MSQRELATIMATDDRRKRPQNNCHCEHSDHVSEKPILRARPRQSMSAGKYGCREWNQHLQVASLVLAEGERVLAILFPKEHWPDLAKMLFLAVKVLESGTANGAG